MNRASIRGLTAALCLTTALCASGARAGTVSPDLKQYARLDRRGDRVRVIVQTHGRPSAGALGAADQEGGRGRRVHRAINGFSLELSPKAAERLARRSDVRRVSLDRKVVGAMDLTSSAVGSTAARTASSLNGAGVGVAVLDTGVASHADLTTPTNRITGWVDLVNNVATPYDDSGHGTHVAGIIAGNGGSTSTTGTDLQGVAPGANIIGVKVLDADMQGYASTVIDGLDWCIANKTALNIRVVNLSFGATVAESYTTDPLCQAVENAHQAGLVVVVAAGNCGRIDPNDQYSGTRYGGITSPGNHPLAITVGATAANDTSGYGDDTVASYSSRGPTLYDRITKPDLVAPGNRVTSLLTSGALATNHPELIRTVGGVACLQLSGTSQATPTVAGAVALMLQADATLTPDTVKARLLLSARKRWNFSVAEYKPYARGAGLLNVGGALAETYVESNSFASPNVTKGSLTGDLNPASTSGSWGSPSLLWGNSFIWGDEVAAASGMTPTSGPTRRSSRRPVPPAAVPEAPRPRLRRAA
ncbi:MAG: S8 family peptidase [Actinomycetota bacterium]